MLSSEPFKTGVSVQMTDVMDNQCIGWQLMIHALNKCRVGVSQFELLKQAASSPFVGSPHALSGQTFRSWPGAEPAQMKYK